MLDKLKKGRYLDFPPFKNTPPKTAQNLPHPDLILIQKRFYNIAESTGKYNPTKHTTSNIARGKHSTKAHRTFRWLPWIPGKITIVPLDGPDVLSGPFTGCWLPIFTLDKTQYIGHIGTRDSSTDPLTVQVKASWQAVKAMPGFTLDASFSPLRQSPLSWITDVQKKKTTIDILAAVSSNRTCKVMGVSPDFRENAKTREIIGANIVPDIQAMMPF